MTKPWLLWAYDPCPEGGWRIEGGFDTREEAIETAKKRHAVAEEQFQDMVEHMQEEFEATGFGTPWKRENECYAGCVVTPGVVFRLDAPKESSYLSG